MEHLILTHEGTDTVETAEPAPGLLVYEIPARIAPESPYRWTLGHTSGLAIGSFTSKANAESAAAAMADLTDWTASHEEIRAAVRPNADLRNRWRDAIHDNGGLHPYDAEDSTSAA